MISSSYIWSWHIWFSYDQPFLYLRSYVCVPIFIHGINGLPISVHRIIGFLMNGLPIIAFLYLRSYDCVFLYPCLPVERGGSPRLTSVFHTFYFLGGGPVRKKHPVSLKNQNMTNRAIFFKAMHVMGVSFFNRRNLIVTLGSNSSFC